MGHVIVEEQNALRVNSELNWKIANLIAEERYPDK